MQKLGANAIRVYHVDPSGDHSGCMSAFADAGIYLFVDLDTFDTQINQVGRPNALPMDACSDKIMRSGLAQLESDPTDRFPKGLG